jgi:hypothetical protein
MTMLKKLALASVVVGVTAMTAGCAGRHDSGYYDDGYHDSRWDHDYDRWRDRHDGDNGRSDEKRVRVCDADGSDCHWEYRER